jgi:hypothetical protein
MDGSTSSSSSSSSHSQCVLNFCFALSLFFYILFLNLDRPLKESNVFGCFLLLLPNFIESSTERKRNKNESAIKTNLVHCCPEWEGKGGSHSRGTTPAQKKTRRKCDLPFERKIVPWTRENSWHFFVQLAVIFLVLIKELNVIDWQMDVVGRILGPASIEFLKQWKQKQQKYVSSRYHDRSFWL